jgi:peptidoglycan hydrolase-like protein with peptidoglycan-binding domain
MEDRVDAIKDHLDHLKDDMGYDEDHEDRDEEETDFHEQDEPTPKIASGPTTPEEKGKMVTTKPEPGSETNRIAKLKIKAIKWMQKYCKIPVDGKVGPKTTECIKRIQKENGLTVDGKLGQKLFKHVIEGEILKEGKGSVNESIGIDMSYMKYLIGYDKSTQ